MSQLTQIQIQLIRGDIRQNGIELIDLEEDLLDHICCAMEEEGFQHHSFEDLYSQIKKKVCPEGFRELQEITSEFITQKFKKMKKFMNVFGIIGSILLLTGSIMKSLHFTGANEGLLLGTLAITLGYLPLMLIISLKQTDAVLGKIRNFSGYIGANLVVIGIFLQILHWSYGKEFLMAGVLLFLFIFVPLFFRSVGKDAMMKIQPTTLSVLIIAVVSSLFAFSSKRPSSMYVNSLLAMNNDSYANYELKRDRLTDLSVENNEATLASSKATNYIEELKKYLVSQVDDKSEIHELNAINIFIMDRVLNDIMVDASDHKYNGAALEQHINALVMELKKTNPKLTTNLSKTTDGKSWLVSHFKDKPLYSVYTTLTNMQLEIVNLELETL